MKIGDRIRISRKLNRIRIKDLAQELEISTPTLKKIENNEIFVNMIIIKKLLNNAMLDLKENEMLEYYYNQKLEKEVSVKSKSNRVYIIIPRDIAIAFEIEKYKEIFCCYLNNRIILQHTDDENYEFIKKKFSKNDHSFIFYLGQRVKYIEGKTLNLNLNLKKQILNITY